MVFRRLLKLSALFAIRDWRAGQLNLLLASLVLAVAAVTSTGFFVDRMRLGLSLDAAQLLGADWVVSSDAPLPQVWADRAQALGLGVARAVSFPSMAISGNDPMASALVAVKAVSSPYPLRGALRIKGRLDAEASARQSGPPAGAVWVDPALLAGLGLAVGDRIELGDALLHIDGLIALEPDRGMAFLNLAPRVMLGEADLADTGLVAAGSRVTYRLLVAGEASALEVFRGEVSGQLSPGQRVESLESGQSRFERIFERAQRFLSLVSLLTVLLATVAVAVAARRFAQRHVQACALLRCLGLTQRALMALLGLEFFWLALLAGVLGIALGFGAHFALVGALAALMPVPLAGPSWTGVVQGLALVFVLLPSCLLAPMVQLGHTPPLRVLRRSVEQARVQTWGVYALGLLGFGLVIWLVVGDVLLGAVAMIGFALTAVLLAVAGSLLTRALGLLGRARMSATSWRLALVSISRRPWAAVVQLVALALGLTVLLALGLVRSDLLGSWRETLAGDTPNRFIINVQSDQRSMVAERLRVAQSGVPVFYPMVRGRLVSINGVAVESERSSSDRQRRLLTRAFNLSYTEQLPAHNTLVAGRWLAPDQPELSMETGIADTLGVALGDRLVFDIAGELVEATVSSLRQVQWDSMQANFFVIMSPALLAQQPQTWMTAVYLPAQAESVVAQLLREAPNLTVIDTGALITQVKDVLDKVSVAVEGLFVLTLLAGVLVLYSAIVATHDERVREAALMRALGASAKQLARAQRTELLLLGALAGLLAALGASAMGWALAEFVFEFRFTPSVATFVVGVVGGCVCAWLSGHYGLRRVLRSPPMRSLSEV